MKVSIFAILLLLCATLSVAFGRSCGDVDKGAAVTKGKRIWNKTFMWSDPKKKQFDWKYCQKKCKSKKNCKAWNYRSSRFGAGCSLYSSVGVNGYTYNYKCQCSTYAGMCK